MSLLSVGTSPLDNVLQNLPQILESCEQEDEQFEEWVESLSAEKYKGKIKYPVFTGGAWMDELAPHWNQRVDRQIESGNDTMITSRPASLLRTEAVISNKYKKFMMENLATLLSPSLRFLNPQTAAAAALRQGVALMMAAPLTDVVEIDEVLDCFPGLYQYAETVYQQAIATRNLSFLDWDKKHHRSLSLQLMGLMEIVDFNKGIKNELGIQINTLVLGYDTLVNIGVPLYHHQPEKIDNLNELHDANAAKTTSKRRTAQSFTSYSLGELHTQCVLCDQYQTESCTSLVAHMEGCLKAREPICCGIKFETIFDALAHFAAFCKKRKKKHVKTACNFCASVDCYCNDNSQHLIRAAINAHSQIMANNPICKNMFYPWALDGLSCAAKIKAQKENKNVPYSTDLKIPKILDYKLLVGKKVENLPDSKFEALMPEIESGGKTPTITENIQGSTVACKRVGDTFCLAVSKLDVDFKLDKLNSHYVCAPFRSMVTYVDLCNKVYGDMKSGCVMKDCSEMASYRHYSMSHLICYYCVPSGGFLPCRRIEKVHYDHLKLHKLGVNENVCCGMCDPERPFQLESETLTLEELRTHIITHRTVVGDKADTKSQQIVWSKPGYIKVACKFKEKGFPQCDKREFTNPAALILHYLKYHCNKTAEEWLHSISCLGTDTTEDLLLKSPYIAPAHMESARRRRALIKPGEPGALLISTPTSRKTSVNLSAISQKRILEQIEATAKGGKSLSQIGSDLSDLGYQELEVNLETVSKSEIKSSEQTRSGGSKSNPKQESKSQKSSRARHQSASSNSEEEEESDQGKDRKDGDDDDHGDKDDQDQSAEGGPDPRIKWYPCKNSSHLLEEKIPTFPTKAGLGLHVAQKHKCPAFRCEFTNMSQTLLMKHYDLAHKKAYEHCSVCDEDVPNLVTHAKMHVTCHICSKEFKSKDVLKEHQKTCQDWQMKREDPYTKPFLLTLPDEEEDRKEMLVDTTKTDNWLPIHLCTILENINLEENQKEKMIADIKRGQLIKDQRRDALIQRKFENKNRHIGKLNAPLFYESGANDKMPKKQDLADLSPRDIFKGKITDDVHLNREQFRQIQSLNNKIALVVQRFTLSQRTAVNLFSDYLADEVKQFISTRQNLDEHTFNTLQYQDLLDLLTQVYAMVDLRELHDSVRDYKRKPHETMTDMFTTIRRCTEMVKIIFPVEQRATYVEQSCRKVYLRNMPEALEKDLLMTEVQMGRMLTANEILKYWTKVVQDGTYKDLAKNKNELYINAVNKGQPGASSRSTVDKLFGRAEKPNKQKSDNSGPQPNSKKQNKDRKGKKRTAAEKPWQNRPARPPPAGKRLKAAGPRSQNAIHNDYNRLNRQVEKQAPKQNSQTQKNLAPINDRLMGLANYPPPKNKAPGKPQIPSGSKPKPKPSPESIVKHKALLKHGFVPKTETYCYYCLEADHISPRCKKYDYKKQPEKFHESLICMREDKKKMISVPCGIHPLNQCVRNKQTKSVRTRNIKKGY